MFCAPMLFFPRVWLVAYPLMSSPSLFGLEKVCWEVQAMAFLHGPTGVGGERRYFVSSPLGVVPRAHANDTVILPLLDALTRGLFPFR